jgi:predicted phosphodiesterase
MKIQVLSDLHLEYNQFKPVQTDADVIVLAGDIANGTDAIPWAASTWPDKQIIYVAGNHEFYRHEMINTLQNLQNCAHEHYVHFLERNEVIIEGVRFLGCTLWTDFRLYGIDQQEKCLKIGNERLNDFRLISTFDRIFLADDSLDVHIASRNWLAQKLVEEPFSGHTVVVTHHAPSWQSVAPKYHGDFLSACFASRLESLLVHSTLWIHGHTHDSFDYVESGTRVVCNPYGYDIGRPENVHFDPKKIIELL